MDEHTDREERFKHLLQPIRDLAQNWDVDIASSLEDYLEDLEEITITLDGGTSKVNFAEAALLIQGSTCVYSRKVEHVYQLVLRTIEFLTQQKHSNASKSNKDGDGVGDGMAVGEDTMFLPLDDLLEEGKHIDLRMDSRNPQGFGRQGKNGASRRSSVGRFNAVSFGEDAYGSQRSSGRNGEGIDREGSWGAKRLSEINRPAMFLMEQDYGNSFKMSTCAVDQSGALLIEGAPVGSTLSANSGRGAHTTSAQNNGFSSDFWCGLQREGDRHGFTQRSAAAGDHGGADVGGFDGGNDDDDSDDGGGGFGGDFDGYRDDDGGMEERKGGETEPVQLLGPRTPNAGRELRQRQTQQQQQQQEQEERKEGESRARADPWAPLDPHDPGSSKPRSFRRGRTYRLPPHLKMKKRRAKIHNADDVEELESVLGPEAKGGNTWVDYNGKLIRSLPLHGLAYPEFQYVGRREKQRKMRQARLARVQAREFMGREDFLAEASASALTLPGEGAGTNMGEYGIDFDGYGSGGDYSSDGGRGAADFGGIYGDDDFGGGDSDDNDYGGGGQDEGGDSGGIAPISLEDAFRDKPQTYEDLCRSHIEAFMRGTERYAHETQLSRRVGAWQNKLEPLMRSQEKRQAFDIHVYGRSVLSKVASALTPAQRAKAQKAKKAAASKAASELAKASAKRSEEAEDIPQVEFGVVVGGKQQFEVCRLFLASLQLANNGNVRLSHGEYAAEQKSTPFRLELLSLQDADNMTGYFAPSAAAASIGTGAENVT